MNSKARIASEIETIIGILSPEIDSVKMRLRLDEVLGQYDITLKSADSLRKDMLDNIRLYISSKHIEGLSSLTLADYYRELLSFDSFVNKPTSQITTSDIRIFLAKNDTVMLSTNGKKLSIIKSFFAWLVDEEIILRNPAAKIKQIKQPSRLPKSLSETELEILREACISFRERALLEVFYSTGCRLSEVSSMLITDIDWSTSSITVIGKGDKERIVYLNPKARYHVERYLEHRAVNYDVCEHLISTERRPYRQLSNKSIQDLIHKIAERSGLDKNVTPHVFRHTMATLAMDNGIELGDLQQLLGHSNPGTTLRYATVSEERKYNAHRRFVR